MSSQLFESQNWSATKEALLEGLDGNKKAVMETTLENTRKYLSESVSAGATSSGNVAVLNKVILPVIRRVMPTVIANELVGVQPMTGKSQTSTVDPDLFRKAGSQGAALGATGGNRSNVNPIKSDTTLSKNINTDWKNAIPLAKISTSKSVPIMPAGQKECAKFVNDFSQKITFVGNAWDAHNNDSLGKRTWSAFTNLNADNIKNIETKWLKINQAGGGKESGPYNTEVKQLVSNLVPKTPPVTLKLDDVVGIYYPPSGHHEEAFYNAGKAYFTNVNGKMTPGKTIKSGQAWGMNTHVGIVGAIKDGQPIIFHNVHGQVFADPANKLYNGGRIAWVKA